MVVFIFLLQQKAFCSLECRDILYIAGRSSASRSPAWFSVRLQLALQSIFRAYIHCHWLQFLVQMRLRLCPDPDHSRDVLPGVSRQAYSGREPMQSRVTMLLPPNPVRSSRRLPSCRPQVQAKGARPGHDRFRLGQSQQDQRQQCNIHLKIPLVQFYTSFRPKFNGSL